MKRMMTVMIVTPVCACMGFATPVRDRCIPKETVAGEAPSLLPQGREFKLVWNDDFHVYGMLWEPDGYTCYIDGKQDGPKVGYSTGDPVSHVPEFILISTEAKWYRNDMMTGKGVPELEAAARSDDAFVVDYVRVYDEVISVGPSGSPVK